MQGLLHAAEQAIAANVLLAWVALICAFVVLAKCADLFVESSVVLARRARLPKLVIGIVLVSLATTAPELSVSVMAAVKGNPEMALGNAIGSVICDDGLALGLAGVFAATPVLIMPGVLRTSGLVLIGVATLAFLFVLPDATLSAAEGAVLLVVFVGYIVHLYREHRKGRFHHQIELDGPPDLEALRMSAWRMGLWFGVGLAGILLASEFIVTSATTIALWLSVPNAVIALTLVALGTSIPEVATCVTAVRKGHGAVAVGNILGADIMNICWVAGASSLANDLVLKPKTVHFMFPAMFVVVGVMLLLLRTGYSLTRRKGVVLLAVYLGYLAASAILFPPEPKAVLDAAAAPAAEAPAPPVEEAAP